LVSKAYTIFSIESTRRANGKKGTGAIVREAVLVWLHREKQKMLVSESDDSRDQGNFWT
jgi:hypothetical protein